MISPHRSESDSDAAHRRFRPTLVSLLVFALIPLLVTACDSSGLGNPPEAPRTSPEVSLATNPEDTEETTSSSMDQYADEETTAGEDTSDREPDAVVRLEGERGTSFTGICSVGEERNVLSGDVPGRFEFRLEGEKLSCVIQKRTDDGGSLRVVLVSDGQTRSVQQTGNAGGEVRLSFSP